MHLTAFCDLLQVGKNSLSTFLMMSGAYLAGRRAFGFREYLYSLGIPYNFAAINTVTFFAKERPTIVAHKGSGMPAADCTRRHSALHYIGPCLGLCEVQQQTASILHIQVVLSLNPMFCRRSDPALPVPSQPDVMPRWKLHCPTWEIM